MAKDKKKEAKKSGKKIEAKKVSTKPVKKDAAKTKPKEKTKLKEDVVQEDDGIIVVEDDSGMDKEAELEARKAYLEEARSQEAGDD